MQCKRIQGLLRSDYFDGEAVQKEQQRIKEHLTQCPECRELEKKLHAQRALFQKTKRQQPPERVWQNIRDTIIAEQANQQSGIAHSILRRLRELISAPRPVFALAGALTTIIFAVILAGAIILKMHFPIKENSGEGLADYRLSGDSDDLFDGLGTNIEEYFL